jgi:hypothetical protein
MALTTASLPAKRIARKRALRLVPSVLGLLLGQQQAAHEVLAEALQRRFDPVEAHDVRADAEDHCRRASVIRRFISITAVDSPSKIARATMAWPMFSSTISGMRATGWTLW